MQTPKNNQHQPHYHSKSIEETVALSFTSLEHGLTADEAKARLAQVGPNAFATGKRFQALRILLSHTFTFINLVLLVASILCVVVSEWIDFGVLLFIIILNIVVGFIQDYGAEKTMASLMKMSTSFATVVRSGETVKIDVKELVPGDLVILKQGDSIPADLRLVSTLDLACDEKLLTGESEAVEKNETTVCAESAPLAEWYNMAFMGTLVQKGKGKGIVVLTGSKTQIGKIAKSLNTATKQKTRLERNMNILGVVLVIVAIVCIGLILMGAGIYGKLSVYPDGLRAGITTAVAIIPEGLIPVITLCMTVGVRAMVKRHVIVRKLKALEELGNVTNICTDKTGTLTYGKMVVTKLTVSHREYTVTGQGMSPINGTIAPTVAPPAEEFTAVPLSPNAIVSQEAHSQESTTTTTTTTTTTSLVQQEFSASLKTALIISHLCNTSNISFEESKAEAKNEEDKWTYVGEPTEIALKVFAHKGNASALVAEAYDTELVKEFPFDSSVKRMSVMYRTKGGQAMLLTKGAPDKIMAMCTSVMEDNGNLQEFTQDQAEKIKVENEELAKQGMRVLAVSCRLLTSEEEEDASREDLESNLCFVGLIGINDPPRSDVPRSIEICHEAGITVHMVTGDQITTATAIAKQIGIVKSESDIVMQAADFDLLTDAQLLEMKQLPVVIARCTPDTKVKLVKTLNARKKSVVMTGDGVNDAPAIKNANVGVSMGITGTDVTKQASDIVLTDDSFSSIVEAVKEGRRTFANIKKFVIHLLSLNIAETIALVVTVVSSLLPALNPTQVLWLNLVTGTPIAMGLGVERAPKGIMNKKKRKLNEAMFSWHLLADVLFYGVVMGCLVLANYILVTFAWLQREEKVGKVVSFATLTLLAIFHAYNCRHQYRSFYRGRLWRSWLLHLAVLFCIGTLAFAIYVPWVNTQVFHHTSMNWDEWMFALAALVVFIVASEAYKFVKKALRKLVRLINERKMAKA